MEDETFMGVKRVERVSFQSVFSRKNKKLQVKINSFEDLVVSLRHFRGPEDARRAGKCCLYQGGVET